MPIDYNRYPPNWKKEIVPRILARAEGKCECCGVARLSNQVRGCKKVWKQMKHSKRQVSRTFHYNSEDEAVQDGCTAVYQTKIILTIAHLDHDETNWQVSDERLKAMCQLCHLQYDAAEKYRRMTERGLKRIEAKMNLPNQKTEEESVKVFHTGFDGGFQVSEVGPDDKIKPLIMSPTIGALQEAVHQNAKSKGFYDNPNQNFGEKCMLIVSEIAEALEAHRKDHRADLNRFETPYEGQRDLTMANWRKIRFESDVKDTVEDELADSLIRILDLAGWMGIDLERHVLLKMEYNSGRERLHGKQY